ncbi:MAG: hypothetical protein Q6J68_05745 [Thermostichales cyanobacterium SZTDM-1c_bins_54]
MAVSGSPIWSSQSLWIAHTHPDGYTLTPDWQRQLHYLLDCQSTLKDLVLYRATLPETASGAELFQLFKEHPELPGVMVQRQAGVGVIARQRFYEHITSFRYSLDVFWQRPLSVMCAFLHGDVLTLPLETPIAVAAQKALQRSPQKLYEPLLVQGQGQAFLLDMQQLLLAHAHIHEMTLDALRLTEAKHRALLQAIPDRIFRLNWEGTFLYGQGHPAPWLRVPPAQVLGLTLEDVLPRDVAVAVRERGDLALSSGEQQVLEVTVGAQGLEIRLVQCATDQLVMILREVSFRPYRAWLEQTAASSPWE